MTEQNDFPLISIAMATYNGEQFLREQLDSIYHQTYPYIEVVVCDDCSIDGTIEILKEYHDKYGLHYIINETNLGFVKNFEKAVSLCSGEYIALSDQDDIWLPNKLEILFSEIQNVSLACSDAKLIDSDEAIFAESFIHYSQNIPDLTGKTNIFVRLLFGNFVTGCTALIKKEVIEKAHPIPDNITYHDWWYAIIASTLNGIYFHQDALILYRQHENNHTGAIRGLTTGQKLNFVINQAYFKKRNEDAKRVLDRLKIYLSSGKFDSEKIAVIHEINNYFIDRQTGFIHPKAFMLALKYRNELYYGSPVLLQYLKCLRSLFL